MYDLLVANKKTEKRLDNYIKSRKDIKGKLQKLQLDPRRILGAHPLHGRLAGKWGCWLGYNIRIIYSIDDQGKNVIIEAVGTHKIY